MNWLEILAVFLGSGLGGACRFLTSKIIQTHCAPTIFPWGTFTVNVIGCFLIGLFYGLFDRYSPAEWMSPQMRLFLTVGFCGGFTTFSTFINENYLLTQSSGLMIVLGYMALSVIVGFLLLFSGYYLTRL